MKSAWITSRVGVLWGSDAIAKRKEKFERKMMRAFAGYCECIRIDCLI
jgi:hypothetical protein